MTTPEAQKLLNKIVKQIFGVQNPLSLDKFMQKFTFDIRLPQPVNDELDGTITWTQSTTPVRFTSLNNISSIEISNISAKNDYLRPKQDLKSIDEIIKAWNEINLFTTERYTDSINVSQSDNIYSSENVYRTLDIRNCKNVLFSNGLSESEFIAACQRANGLSFCIRTEDSNFCTNCFNVSFSTKLTDCFFMHDTADMHDSMFCTNISSKRFCIANMQYTEEEYNAIKKIVTKWILS